jgi:AcrR family transcriptional regulator
MSGSAEQSSGALESAYPETRRRKETKERLLAAALDVFAKTGVAAASIEQICEAAGFTRGAFYSNFSTKEDLLIAILAQEQDSAIYQAESALTTAVGESQPESMDALDTAVLSSLATLPECGLQWMRIRREVQLAALRDVEVARKFMASESAMYERITRLLEATLKRLGRKSVIPPSDLSRLLLAVFDLSEQERLLATPDALPATGLFARALPALLTQFTERAK